MNPISHPLPTHFIKQTIPRLYVNTTLRKSLSYRIGVFFFSAAYHNKKLSTVLLTSHSAYNIKPLNRQIKFRQISFSAKSPRNKNFNNEPTILTKEVYRLTLALLLAATCLTLYTTTQMIHSEETETIKKLSLDELETIARAFETSLPNKKTEDSYAIWQLKCEWFCFDIVLRACLDGKWRIIDELHQTYPDLLENLTNQFKRSLLQAAVQEGSEECIKALINRNIAISRTDSDKNTPLHLAIKEGRSEEGIIKALCREYAKQVNAKEETALHIAVRYGQDQLIPLLISNGIRENAFCSFKKDERKDERMAFDSRIRNQSQENTTLDNEQMDALENTALNHEQMDALMLAVALGKIECLNVLMIHMKNPNLQQISSFGNILHVAIKYGQGKMLRHLLNRYYEQTKHLINQGNASGRTVLSLASEQGLLEEVEFLINEKQASHTLPDKQGKTCAHWAAIGAKNAKKEDREKHLKTIEMLGYLKVDLEIIDIDDLDPKNSKRPLDYLGNNPKAIERLKRAIEEQKEGMKDRPNHNILYPPQNLVFQGGGGPKGIAYIGFLSALKEKGLLSEVKRVAGTSAGAITAALFAVGYTPNDLKELLLDFDLTEFLDPNEDNKQLLEQAFLTAKSKGDLTTKLSPIVKHLLKENLKDLFHLSSREGLLRRLSKLEGLCQGEKFREWLDDRIAEKVSKITGEKIENCKYLTFGELDKYIQEGHKGLKHLYIVATQINQELKQIDFNAKDTKHVIISDAVRASMSLPAIFEPHVIYYKDKQNKRYTRNDAPKCVDGGVIRNFPLNIFDNRGIPNPRTLGAALRVIEDKKELEKDPEIKTPLDIIKALVNVYINSEAILTISEEFNPDRIIEIPIEGVGLFDFNLSQEQKKAMIRSGKRSANEAPSLQGKIEETGSPAKQEKIREKIDLFSRKIHNDFIKRDKYFKILKDKISSASTLSLNIPVYVLYGLPGMGKTQIARNLAKRHRDDFSNIWIINYRTEEQKNRCYKHIAKKLKIKSEGMNDIELRKAVHENLANQPQGDLPWLLILDNVNQPLNREVDLPKKGGYIIVTTNKKDNCPWSKQSEKVGPLSKEESLDLLTKVTQEERSDEMRQLAKSLGYFPLALNLSAQYIKINELTIKKFITDYDFKRTVPPFDKDKFYKYTLKDVWDITLEGIKNDCPEASEWLTLCAFLNPDRIPQSLIMEWAKTKSNSEAIAKENSRRILNTLQSYHVFNETDKKDTYSIHELLKQTLRNRQEETLLENFQATFSFLKEIGKELENSDMSLPEKIKTLEDWWPIQFSCLFDDVELINKIKNEDKIQALMALTNYTIYDLADFRLGIRFANLGLTISHQENDLRSKAIFFLSKLGQAHLALDNYEEGKRYISESIKEKTQLFGENSREVAQEKHHLIKKQLDLYHDKQDQQQTQQAINDLEKLLQIFKKENNGINSEVAECSHTIGNALFELSQLEKDRVRKKELQETSLQKYQDALTIIKQIPRSHLNIVQATIPISTLLINLKRYVEAKELLIEVKKKINKESLDMGTIKSHLGEVYHGFALTAKTKREKAEFLKKSHDKQLRALNIIQKQVGENDYFISFPLFKLGIIYEDQNELNLSLNYLKKSYVIRKEYFKTDQHWEVREVLDAISRIQEKQNPSNLWCWVP